MNSLTISIYFPSLLPLLRRGRDTINYTAKSTAKSISMIGKGKVVVRYYDTF